MRPDEIEPIVPVMPERTAAETDPDTARPDGGLSGRYEAAEWGAPLVPEF